MISVAKYPIPGRIRVRHLVLVGLLAAQAVAWAEPAPMTAQQQEICRSMVRLIAEVQECTNLEELHAMESRFTLALKIIQLDTEEHEARDKQAQAALQECCANIDALYAQWVQAQGTPEFNTIKGRLVEMQGTRERLSLSAAEAHAGYLRQRATSLTAHVAIGEVGHAIEARRNALAKPGVADPGAGGGGPTPPCPGGTGGHCP